jgi:adenine deaminase
MIMAFIKNLQKLIRQAGGMEPADLVLKDCHIVNVFTGELMRADIACCDQWIAGVGTYGGIQEMDCSRYLACPGFIEGHIHIESSLLCPEQFVNAVLPSGTTTVICDPHEIANVAGMAGIRYILEETEDLPVSVYVMAPSCVPATHLETSGAFLGPEDIALLLDHPRVLGLAEVMNFPGVLNGNEEILAKIGHARTRRKAIDGHSPGLGGKPLQAYLSTGIASDHECTSAEEALEKLRSGMHLFIREGGAARNLEALLPVVNEKNAHRCLFVTDDCPPDVLQKEGHLDRIIRKAVRLGLDPIMAIQMVTVNAARFFHLEDRGAIAAGYRADLVLFENMEDLRPCHVFAGGRHHVECGKAIQAKSEKGTSVAGDVFQSVRIQNEKVRFSVPVEPGMLRVMRVVENQIVTETAEIEATVVNGMAVADPKRDLAKIAVVERHCGTGNVGVGFVIGIGLQKGALAGSITHDSHNIIVVGMSDEDMGLAVRSVAEAGGGLAVVADNQVLAFLRLDVAGLMSTRSLTEVNEALQGLLAASRTLGTNSENPFMLMSFLALPVIPHLKITDLGVVDVDAFSLVKLWR